MTTPRGSVETDFLPVGFSFRWRGRPSRIGSSPPYRILWMMTSPLRYSWLVLPLLVTLTTPAPAVVVQTGNVTPDVNTWRSFTDGRVGDTSDGSVALNAGSLLNSSNGYLGY